MTHVPVLETPRLRLRLPRLDDWPPFLSLLASDRAQYMGGPYSQEGAWGTFCHGVALWQLYGAGALSVELRDTGQWIGQVEINQGPRFPEAELGWQISTQAEGKGYAKEAAAALRDWAFRERPFKTLVSYIDPKNQRSLNLAERLGANVDPHAPPQDIGDLVYRHSAGLTEPT